MKQTLKKLLTAFLATVIAVYVTANVTPTAEAANLTETEFAQKIAQLKQEYPDGMYWSKTNGTDENGISKAGPNPCTSHWASNGTCGEYKGVGWQCFGFANVLAMKVFGTYATKFSDGSYRGAGWEYYRTVDVYRAGDYVRLATPYGHHSVFITKVEGDTISIADSNSVGLCQIDWDGKYTKAKMDSEVLYVIRYGGNTLTGTGTAMPTLTVNYNTNGGVITRTNEYIVQTEGDYLNVRSGTSTGTAIMTSLPDRTVINVYETVETNGYVWGRIILPDGRTGWCALVDSAVTEYNAVYNGFWETAGTVKKGQDNFGATLNYGSGQSMTLPYHTPMGMSRYGYIFKGWSNSQWADILYIAGGTVTAEELVPYHNNQNQTVTLYAVWEREPPTVEIIKLPQKTTYTVGESIDLQGLELKLTYTDGETVVVKQGFTVSGFDSQTAGTKTVRVSYGEQYAEFNVTVEEIKPPAPKPPIVPPEERPVGDMDGDGETTSDDAIYLLYHVLFGEADFPVIQNADYDGDGRTTSDDAIYLLYHVLFGSADFPL